MSETSNDRLAGVVNTKNAAMPGSNPANSLFELLRRKIRNTSASASSDVTMTADEAAALGIPAKPAPTTTPERR